VACFIKDFSRKSYYIQFINVDSFSIVWEQELYREMTYLCPESWFHMFEADSGQAGLSFADVKEAGHFQRTIEDKLERIRPQQQQVPLKPIQVKKSSTGGKVKKTKAKGSKEKITKLDISRPQEGSFVHLTGMRQTGPGGRMQILDNSDKLDPRLRDFLLERLNIDVAELTPREVQQAKQVAEDMNLYDTIDRVNTVRHRQPNASLTIEHPTPSPRAAAAVGKVVASERLVMDKSRTGISAVLPLRPPPLPDRNIVRQEPAGRVKPRPRPPGPPPVQTTPPANRPGLPHNGKPIIKPPRRLLQNSTKVPSPPPPPPPPGLATVTPAPPPVTPSPSVSREDRSRSDNSPSQRGRGHFLDEVRMFDPKKLNKVDVQEVGPVPHSPNKQGDLSHIISIAIKDYRENLGHSSSDSDTEDDASDSWDEED